MKVAEYKVQYVMSLSVTALSLCYGVTGFTKYNISLKKVVEESKYKKI